MMLVSSAPKIAPISCTAACLAASLADKPLPGRRLSRQSTADITGLKWPPETGPNPKINTASPNTVAVLFSGSCKPLSDGDNLAAAIPDSTTTVTRMAVPSSSASSGRCAAIALDLTPDISQQYLTQY
jgi:hypothetical protein